MDGGHGGGGGDFGGDHGGGFGGGHGGHGGDFGGHHHSGLHHDGGHQHPGDDGGWFSAVIGAGGASRTESGGSGGSARPDILRRAPRSGRAWPLGVACLVAFGALLVLLAR
ncbi:hypothetical protein [Kitasatospora mediocidica]|uniref:hypothetical protein n=1 Tax=Kitasatospora mediocidica TaxID=58352 RepID=UPI00055E211C|nr:hypothetical protein [Kitasatospora mediocidica]